MSVLRSFARFGYEFVVGDDWTIALGVVFALGVTAVIAEVDAAWFVTPIGVIALLGISVWRAARSASRS